MCIICTAAKKRHMKREEVLEAIKRNSSGFFGYTVHDGARRTIRTLDEKAFMKFFDEVVEDDDPWVMHARIPSRGEKTLDNVHGWEQDNILFMHNMTISSIDGMMERAGWKNTDSEFFFRKIFMPYYRGCGEEAYRDGKFHPDLDNIVRHFASTFNKFLFIMPDGRMIRYGDWVNEPDRKEGGEIAFWASNTTYKTYKPAWTPFAAAGKAEKAETAEEPDDADFGYGYRYEYISPYYEASPGWKADGDVDEVVKTVGTPGICRFAVADLAGRGLASYKSAMEEDKHGKAGWIDDLDYQLVAMLPAAFSDSTLSAVTDGLDSLVKSAAYRLEDFVADYAAEFAPGLLATVKAAAGFGAKAGDAVKDRITRAVERLEAEWRIFCRIAGLRMDWDAKGAADLAVAFEPMQDKKGRWKPERIRPEDILVDRDLDAKTAFKGLGMLLPALKKGDGA